MRPEEMPWDLRGSEPWRVAGLVSLSAAYLVSFLIVAVAWYGASDQASWNDTQLMWVNVGGGGVILAGAVSALWVMQGRRMVGRKRSLLLPNVERSTLPTGEQAATSTEEPPDALVTSPRMTKYHLAGCPMTDEKDLTDLALAEARATREPCKVCLPPR